MVLLHLTSIQAEALSPEEHAEEIAAKRLANDYPQRFAWTDKLHDLDKSRFRDKPRLARIEQIMFSQEEQAALPAVERLRRVEAALADPDSDHRNQWLKEEERKAIAREADAVARGENPHYPRPW